MPKINISIENLAETIRKLEKKDLETLPLLLSDTGEELLKRKKEIENKAVKALSCEEVFDV